MPTQSPAASYASNTTYPRLAERLRQAERVVVLTHTKPDGDAVGSVLAVQRALTLLGKQATGVLMGPVEPGLLELARPTVLERLENGPLPEEVDLVVVVDTGAWAQLEPVAPWLRTRRDRTIGLDHHARGDEIAGERMIDVRAASCTQVLVPLIEALGCPLTGGPGGVAEALFVGLATDTGWFRFANADAAAFALAARLLKSGVDKGRIYQVLEETARPSRLALTSRALSSLRLVADGAAAVMSLGMSDFTETGGALEDLTGIVNEPMAVRSVRVSALLTQTDPGLTKVSLRSKPAIAGGADGFVNVNDLAARFGGGGHANAAGARIKADLDAAQAQIEQALEAAIKER
ncbi:MAG: DHH family phosphoesterase [Phycisphaerales bacterium]|nr:DHH family phosphoesterase [Phycisphaerales bacterium]